MAIEFQYPTAQILVAGISSLSALMCGVLIWQWYISKNVVSDYIKLYQKRHLTKGAGFLWPLLPDCIEKSWQQCSGVKREFLDIPLSEPGILRRYLWLSLAKNLSLNFLDSTFGGKFKDKERKNSFRLVQTKSAFSNGFFQDQEEMVHTKYRNSISTFLHCSILL